MLPDIASLCCTQLDFMRQADEMMLAAVAASTPLEITVLQHIYLAEEVWLSRALGDVTAVITDITPPSDIAALEGAWPDLHRRWLEWARSVTDWDADMAHCNQAGKQFHMPRWQCVLHVVNHGSYHRGQIAASIRAKGIAPPSTDLILYYRRLNASAA